MSTRRLIAIALLCGLAILIAGGIQLFRLSDTSERTVDVLAEGETATVGGIEVTVDASRRDTAATRVTVSLISPTGRETVPVSDFTLLVGGALERPTSSDGAVDLGGGIACADPVSVDESGTSCTVLFPPRDGTATLSFSRDGEQRIWRLDPTPS